MLFNATLLRVDPPPPGLPGPTVAVRCALTEPTVAQAREIREMSWPVTVVAYVPLRTLPPDRPATEGRVEVRPDGGAPTLYRVVWIVQRNARTLGHVQLYLAPV